MEGIPFPIIPFPIRAVFAQRAGAYLSRRALMSKTFPTLISDIDNHRFPAYC
jgi:hypothetical protein